MLKTIKYFKITLIITILLTCVTMVEFIPITISYANESSQSDITEITNKIIQLDTNVINLTSKINKLDTAVIELKKKLDSADPWFLGFILLLGFGIVAIICFKILIENKIETSLSDGFKNIDISGISKKVSDGIKNELNKQIESKVEEETKIKNISPESINQLIDDLNEVSDKAKKYLTIGDNKNIIEKINTEITKLSEIIKPNNNIIKDIELPDNKTINPLNEIMQELTKIINDYSHKAALKKNAIEKLKKSIEDNPIRKLLLEISSNSILSFLKKDLELKNYKKEILNAIESSEFSNNIFEYDECILNIMDNDKKINIFQKFMEKYRLFEYHSLQKKPNAQKLFEDYKKSLELFNEVYEKFNIKHVMINIGMKKDDYSILAEKDYLEITNETDRNRADMFKPSEITQIETEGFTDCTGEIIIKVIARINN